MDDLWRRLRGRLAGLRDALPSPLARFVERLGSRDILMAGSSLAFYGLVSLLPLLLMAFALVSAVAGQETLTEFTRRTAQTGSAGIASVLGQLTSNAPSLTWVTVLSALWPATAYGGGLRRALMHASPGEEQLSGLRGRMLGLGLVLVLPVLILAGVPLMFVILQLAQDGLTGVLLGTGVAFLVAVVVGSGLTTLLYHTFSPARIGLRESVGAAVLVSGITAAFSLGFVLYLQLGQVEERFGGGTVGAVVLMGVWLFVANVVLLAGYHAVLELSAD